MMELALFGVVLAGGDEGFLSGVAAGDTATCAGLDVVTGVATGGGVVATGGAVTTGGGGELAVAVAVTVAVAGADAVAVAVAGAVTVTDGGAGVVAVATVAREVVAADVCAAAEELALPEEVEGPSPPKTTFNVMPSATTSSTPAAMRMTVLPEGPETGRSTGSLAAAASAVPPLIETEARAAPADGAIGADGFVAPSGALAPSSMRRRLRAFFRAAASGSSLFGALGTAITGAAASAGGADTTFTTGATSTAGATGSADSTVGDAEGAESAPPPSGGAGVAVTGSAGGGAGTTTAGRGAAGVAAAETGPAGLPVPITVLAAGRGMGALEADESAATFSGAGFALEAPGGSGSTRVSEGAAAGDPAAWLGSVTAGVGVARVPSASVAELLGRPWPFAPGSSSGSHDGRNCAACRSASSGERGFSRSAATIATQGSTPAS